jgi:hypothetical protein
MRFFRAERGKTAYKTIKYRSAEGKTADCATRVTDFKIAPIFRPLAASAPARVGSLPGLLEAKVGYRPVRII